MLAKTEVGHFPQPRERVRQSIALRAARHRQPRGDGLRGAGRREVVKDGVTRVLVPFEPVDDCTRRPRDEQGFVQAIAEAVNEPLADSARGTRYGKAGRRRPIERFDWPAVAAETVDLYRALL